MAAPSPISCIEKRRLMDEFQRAVSHHNRMQVSQVAAVIRGEDFPFEREIAEAAERRDNAKYAIIAHQKDHGCL